MKRFTSMLLAALLLMASCAFADGNISIDSVPTAKAGEYITIGEMEQDGRYEEIEPIEWLILEVDGDRALVISRYGLANLPFNTNSAGQTWENCSLRDWLNGKFFDTVFSTREKQAILYAEVDESEEQCCADYPPARLGGSTRDRVFVLSYAEMERLLPDPLARLCAPTVTTLADGSNKSDGISVDGRRTCWYWLRSPAFKNNVCCVNWDGTIVTSYISHTFGVVRPCMWVSLSGVL